MFRLQYFNGLVDPKEFSRLRGYAARVRAISAHSHSIDPSVFQELYRMAGDDPLLPSLRIFDWTQEKYLHRELGLFLSPELKVLVIQCPDPFQYPKDTRPRSEEEEFGLIMTLVFRAPALRLFSLARVTMAPKALDLLSRLRNLQSLELIHLNNNVADGLDPLEGLDAVLLPGFTDTSLCLPITVTTNLVRSLPSLSRLNFLSINVDAVEACPNLGLFSCLNVLRVFGMASSIYPFLSTVNAPNLEVLMLINEPDTHNADSWISIAGCVSLVASQWEHTLLRFSIIRELEDRTYPRAPLLEVLDPLLRATSLKCLEIEAGDYFSLSDDDILKLALAWPDLYSLRIVQVAGDPKPSIVSLGVIATHLRALSELQLPVDCSVHPPEILTSVLSSHPLVQATLHPIKSQQCDVEALQNQLRRLFPNLEKFEDEISSPSDDNDLGWTPSVRETQVWKYRPVGGGARKPRPKFMKSK